MVQKLAQTFDEENLRRELEINRFLDDLHGRELLEKALFSTNLNIQGISAGYEGPLFKTILPNKITAKVESRLVPDKTKDETAMKIRAYLDRMDYTI